jgi:glycerol-3-phosphate O-acyltransferase / dihydroxyacetone phosphate acyltransferase
MLYKIFKVIVGFSLNIFFRKIYVSGLEHIKPDTPQLIASNHPNGFMEPLIMACHFPRPLHFMVRGDVFEKKWLKPILVGTNQIPIFRFKDGFSKLRENAALMDDSTKLMTGNNMLLIYAEGSTENVKQLRPLQKGVARIAFSVLEQDPNTRLEILPSGINFTHPQNFGRTVMLRVGAALKIQDYKGLYHQDQKAAYQKLLDDLYNSMKPHVIHGDDLSDSSLLEDMLAIDRGSNVDSYIPVKRNHTARLDSEIRISNLYNQRTSSLIDSIKSFKTEVKQKGLTLNDLRKQPLNMWRILVLLLGFPLAMLGLITHIVPLTLGKRIAFAKVKHEEFIACVWFAITITIMIIYYLVMLILQLSLSWSWFVLPVVITSGLWLRYYYNLINNTIFTVRKDEWTSIKNKGLAIINAQY